MPKRQRIPAHIIDADRDLIETLQDLIDYAPRDPNHSLAAMQQIDGELSAKQRERRRLVDTLNQLDDEIVELEYLYHDRALGVKDEAIGQYGRNSPALKAVGLKPRARSRRRKLVTSE